MCDDFGWFRQTLTGMLLGALLMVGFPAVAAQVGDALALGEVNNIDDRTDLKGDAKGANLQIKNTGNASALTAKADRNAIKAKATDGPVALNARASRNAVKIKVDAGQSPVKVNAAAGTAINLSADLLDGMDSTAFLGATNQAADSDLLDGLDSTAFLQPSGVVAAHAGGDQFEVVTSVDAVLRSVSLTAPSAGVVIVNSTADASESMAGDKVRCSITTGTIVDPAFLQRWESGGSLDGEFGQLAATRGFAVTPGEAFTANLVCEHDGTSGSTNIFDTAMTAIFIPNP